MVMQIEPDLTLDQCIDQQSDHCEHGQCGNPLGFLEPHRRNGSRILDPAKPWLHRAMLVVIGLEDLRIGTYLSVDGRREDGPPIVGLSPLHCRHLYDHAIALRHLGWVCFGRTSSLRTLDALREGLDAIAEAMRAPGPRPTPTATWGAAF